MAKKKSGGGINFKQLMLQKGERYGFYLAGALLLLFLFLGGYKAATSASSGEIVGKFDKGVASINSQIARKSGDSPKELDGVIYDRSTVPHIPFTEYAARNDLFNTTANEQTRRMNPRLFPPIEAQVNFVRGSILVHDIFEKEDGKWYIVVLKNRPATRNDPRQIDRIKKKTAGRPQGPPAQTAPAGAAPPTGGGFAGAPGRPGSMLGAAAAGQTDVEPEAMEVSDKNLDQAQLAETLDPRRIVVVTLAIPYKAQVEEYRRALRAKDKDNLSEYPEYRGFVVERRRLALDGTTEEQPWAPLDMQATLKDLINKAVDIEPETAPRDMDPTLAALYSRVLPPDEFKLLVPRPKMNLREYPSVNLPSVTKALEELKKKGGQALDIHTQTEEQLNNSDIFSVRGSGGGPQNVPPPPGGRGLPSGYHPPGKRTYTPPPGAGGNNQAEVRVDDEDAWIMRFLDVTAEPGHAYQYRVALLALNPNHNKPAKELATPSLAEKEMLQSEFFEVDTLASVPPEDFLYAATKDDRTNRSTERMSTGDDVWVQMQKWYAAIRPEEYSQAQPFGEWLVADIKAFRGQRVEEVASVTLPMWDIAHAMFLFRENNRRRSGSRRLEPTWTIPLSPTPPVILVDFEGGNGQYTAPKNKAISDAAGVEMLFLQADGQLRVSRSGPDLNDADRVKRDQEWRTWLEKVWQDTVAAKNRGDMPNGPGGTPGRPGRPGRPGGP